VPKRKPVVDVQAFAGGEGASIVVVVDTAAEAVAAAVVVDTAAEVLAAAADTAEEVLAAAAVADIVPEKRHFEVLEAVA
jgi:hypothetical protein